ARVRPLHPGRGAGEGDRALHRVFYRLKSGERTPRALIRHPEVPARLMAMPFALAEKTRGPRRMIGHRPLLADRQRPSPFEARRVRAEHLRVTVLSLTFVIRLLLTQ